MSVIISGSTGIARPLGSAGSPSDVNTSDATTGLYFPASNTVGISTAGTNALYIDASQNVGIGTTSLSQKLQVNGSIYMSAGNGTAVSWASDLSSHYVKFDSTLNGLIMQGFGGLAFYTGGANERMRIDSSGNVNIGTTSYSSTSPGTQFSPANGIAITSNAGFNIQCNKASAPSQTAWQVFNVNNTLQGYINYTNPGTQYVTSSDVRLKTNIVDSSSALPILSRLQVRSFDWKENGSHEDYQWIAQEVYSVFPAAAAKGVDKEDGNIELPWGVDPAKMVGLCIKAIQELSAEVTALKAKVGA